MYYFSFSDLKPKIAESKDIVELSKHFFMVNLEVRVLAFKEKKNKLIEIISFNKHWGKVKDSHGTLIYNYIGDVFFRTMKYQKMENMTLMDHMFQELFSSVILTFCNLPAIAVFFSFKKFVLLTALRALELYKTDSDGKLNKEIDNEGTDLDKTKFFYKTADESEYRKKDLVHLYIRN